MMETSAVLAETNETNNLPSEQVGDLAVGNPSGVAVASEDTLPNGLSVGNAGEGPKVIFPSAAEARKSSEQGLRIAVQEAIEKSANGGLNQVDLNVNSCAESVCSAIADELRALGYVVGLGKVSRNGKYAERHMEISF